jgi:hypothetical protein
MDRLRSAYLRTVFLVIKRSPPVPDTINGFLIVRPARPMSGPRLATSGCRMPRQAGRRLGTRFPSADDGAVVSGGYLESMKDRS